MVLINKEKHMLEYQGIELLPYIAALVFIVVATISNKKQKANKLNREEKELLEGLHQTFLNIEATSLTLNRKRLYIIQVTQVAIKHNKKVHQAAIYHLLEQFITQLMTEKK